MEKRTVFISGGTRGIGRGLVYGFFRQGYNVAFAFKKSEKEAERIEKELNTSSQLIKGFRCDVSKSDEVSKLKSEIENNFGFIDTVINNAGISRAVLFNDETEQGFDEIVSVNLKSVFLITHAFLPKMLSERFGRIINISSIWGQVGASMETLYSMTKAGVIGLTKALAKETALNGITVNAIASGLVDTDMNKNLSKEELNDFISSIPVMRIGTTDDICNSALFLANEKSSYITGQVISVSGGLVI